MQVSIWLVRGLIGAVEHAGTPRDQFLTRAGIAPELVERGDLRLDLCAYMRALEAALDVSRDPGLGLRWGEHVGTGMYHVVGHLVEHAASLADGIAMAVRYSTLLAAGFEPQLIEQGERATLRLPYLVGNSRIVSFTAELALTAFQRMLQQYVGESARSARACFAYAAPAHAADYERIFAGAACFDQPFTEMQFPRAWLAQSHLHANSELRRLLQSHAEQELSELVHGGRFSERVERVLAQSDPRALPSMNDVARRLDISTRTLARRLQAEDVTFPELVESRRATQAKRLLAGRRMTIRQIADVLGFADTPAFHKAFRRWTGLTPKQYTASVSR